MTISKKEVLELQSYISEASKLSSDPDTVEFFSGVVGYIDNALDNVADNEEKFAYLLDACTRWANQISFILFREGNITDKLMDKFRSFTPVKDTSEAYKKFSTARESRYEEIRKLQEDLIREEKGLDIFKAIVGGMDKEEAKKKVEEYESQIEEAKKQFNK